MWGEIKKEKMFNLSCQARNYAKLQRGSKYIPSPY